jgi:hypothetical protein
MTARLARHPIGALPPSPLPLSPNFGGEGPSRVDRIAG